MRNAAALSVILLTLSVSCCKPTPVVVTESQKIDLPECAGYEIKAVTQEGTGTTQFTLFHPDGSAPMMVAERGEDGAWSITDTGGMVVDAPPPGSATVASGRICVRFGKEDKAAFDDACVASLVGQGFCVSLKRGLP